MFEQHTLTPAQVKSVDDTVEMITELQTNLKSARGETPNQIVPMCIDVLSQLVAFTNGMWAHLSQNHSMDLIAETIKDAIEIADDRELEGELLKVLETWSSIAPLKFRILRPLLAMAS